MVGVGEAWRAGGTPLQGVSVRVAQRRPALVLVESGRQSAPHCSWASSNALVEEGIEQVEEELMDLLS